MKDLMSDFVIDDSAFSKAVSAARGHFLSSPTMREDLHMRAMVASGEAGADGATVPEGKRWSEPKQRFIPAPNVLAFLSEIDAVCQKYGFEITHESAHGRFTIERYQDGTWLLGATVGEVANP